MALGDHGQGVHCFPCHRLPVEANMRDRGAGQSGFDGKQRIICCDDGNGALSHLLSKLSIPQKLRRLTGGENQSLYFRMIRQVILQKDLGEIFLPETPHIKGVDWGEVPPI